MPNSRLIRAAMRLAVLLVGVAGGESLLYAGESVFAPIYAKPHAPVEIQYQLNNPSASGFAGEPFQVTLSFKNKVDVDDLLVSVRLDSALQSSVLQAQYNYGVTPVNNISSIEFDVTAPSAGDYRIYITATVVNSGKSQSHTVIMPLKVGSVPAVANKSLRSVIIDSTGTAIISMQGTAVSH